MTPWSDDMIQKTKDLFKDDHGKELTTEDAIECLDNMTRFTETLIDIYQEQKARGIDTLTDTD